MKLRFCFLTLLLLPTAVFAEELLGSTDSKQLYEHAQSLTLTLPTENGPVTFNLVKRDIRSPNYHSEVTGKKSKRKNKVSVDLYRTVNDTGSFARLSVLRTGAGSPEIHGVFNDGQNLYGVSPIDQSSIPTSQVRTCLQKLVPNTLLKN